MTELAEALSAIHCDVFPKGWNTGAIAEMLAVPGTFALLAEGGMIIIRVAAEQADLITLAVREASRRQGIAKRLLREAMIKAAGMGAEKLFLEVAAENRAALKLYEKCGFLEISRRKAYYEGGKDALVMCCALTVDAPSLS